MISPTRSSWKPVCSVVPKVWILAPTVFSILLKDLDGGPECTLSSFLVIQIKEKWLIDQIDNAAIQGDLRC